MVSSPLVSVLLPCYNAAATLDEALNSLAAQTLRGFEIIAVDDGSTDDTLARLKRRAAAGLPLAILTQPHGGIVPALNRGLQACRGLYVARMDADDRSRPERLARQAAYLDAHPETAVVSCLVSAFPPTRVRQGFQIYLEWLNSLVTNEQICRQIFVESPLAHPSVMFRRTVVEQAGSYQEHGWPEDYDLWLRLYLQGAGFAKLPEVLFEWRETPGRLTRTDSRYSVENFLRAKAHYLKLGPLAGCDAVIVWGAGMMGRRLGRQLIRLGLPLVAFIDVDPRKIGSTRHGRPIRPPTDLLELRQQYTRPMVVTGVGARGARPLIRQQLENLGLVEGPDWIHAA